MTFSLSDACLRGWKRAVFDVGIAYIMYSNLAQYRVSSWLHLRFISNHGKLLLLSIRWYYSDSTPDIWWVKKGSEITGYTVALKNSRMPGAVRSSATCPNLQSRSSRNLSNKLFLHLGSNRESIRVLRKRRGHTVQLLPN